MGLDDPTISDKEKSHRVELSYYCAYLQGYMDALKRVSRLPILNEWLDGKPTGTQGDQ